MDFIFEAIKINPVNVDFYQFLSKAYQQRGAYDLALGVLDQAIAMEPACSVLYLMKGTLLIEAGETLAAEEQFLHVVEDSAANTRVLAHYSLVQLRRVTAEHVSLDALLRLIEHDNVSVSKLEYIYFALGKCYDDMGEWARAFNYFKQGCQLKRARITYNIVDQIEFTDRLIQNFTQQTLDYLRSFAHPSALPIFVVGMPRSGTTLVEQILSSHPDVYGAGELAILNDLLPWSMQHYEQSDRYSEMTKQYIAYLQQFSPDAGRITDKMPHNFMAIGFIHALFPHAKIIHVKRNPIDTCVSCYTKLFTDGHLYSYDLAELGQYYRCYERIIAHWRHLLPSGAWLEIEYESVVNQLDVEVRRLLAFCDLAWDPVCLDFHRLKRQVRTASAMQVRQPIYTSSIERWRRYEVDLSPLIECLSQQQV